MRIDNYTQAEITKIVGELVKEMKNFTLEKVGVSIDFVDPYNNTIVVDTSSIGSTISVEEVEKIVCEIICLLAQPLKYWTDQGLMDFPDMITIDIKGKPKNIRDATLGHGGFASVLVSKPENSTIFNKALGVLYIEENGELLAEIGVRPYSETWYADD